MIVIGLSTFWVLLCNRRYLNISATTFEMHVLRMYGLNVGWILVETFLQSLYHSTGRALNDFKCMKPLVYNGPPELDHKHGKGRHPVIDLIVGQYWVDHLSDEHQKSPHVMLDLKS